MKSSLEIRFRWIAALGKGRRAGPKVGGLVSALAATLAVGLGAGQAATADALTVASASAPTQWTINFQGRPVLIYAFDPHQFKPYVKALNTLSGYGVLRDSPADHLHHHALMYGIRVNGVNFWEETPGCGVQKVVESPAPEILSDPTGHPVARLVQRIYWVSPEDAFLPNTNCPALLIEKRTLTLRLDLERQETALRWQSSFEVGSKTNVVTLTGASYHGLGMRFLRELDPLAVHLTNEGTLDLSNNRQDTSVHSWEAVLFDLPDRPATIALFSGPANARGMAHCFAMKTPFAYLAATQGLDLEPLTYRRGDRFELNYLVALYPELKSAGALAERGRQWSESLGNR